MGRNMHKYANAEGLTTVLKGLKNKRVDITIFLGDILTYDYQPREVMSILNEYKRENPAIFIKGNPSVFKKSRLVS